MNRIGELRDWLISLPPQSRRQAIAALSPAQRRGLQRAWEVWARPAQLPPPGDWSIWLICAGRGFGKTRAGAEWVCRQALRQPEARIALVGASLGDARAVMVEGESGILAVMRGRGRVRFEPALRRITWPGGARATLFSAAEPEGLRGAQHSHAWCDEIGKWPQSSGRAMAAWDNLLLGLRLGASPQVVATTTPRAVPLVQRLLREAEAGGVVLSRGSSFENAANLPSQFLASLRRHFGKTALGRQEVEGLLLEDHEGALWSRALIERCRASAAPERLVRVVVAVDPPAGSHGDACGIVVAGLGEDGLAWVLADCSVEGTSPETWARAVDRAARTWAADRVVAEANQGGAMVAAVLRAANAALPLRLVHATRGKVARAEPVAALYEAGRVRHAGLFAQLEDQLCGLIAGGTYQGPGRSPDRADALVWALTELLLASRHRPQVRPV